MANESNRESDMILMHANAATDIGGDFLCIFIFILSLSYYIKGIYKGIVFVLVIVTLALGGYKKMGGRRRRLLKDNRGVSTLTSYIMISSIAIIFFGIIAITTTGTFIRGPSQIVMRGDFSDIGNDISTKIVDIYIVAPENGTLNTSLRMPTSVAMQEYEVNAEAATADQMIKVSALHTNTEVTVTINEIAQANTVNVTGSTLSGNQEHWLRYNSTEGEIELATS